MIVRFFKMGLFPLTAIVPVFDQGSGRVESRRCRFDLQRSKARSKSRIGPILSKCAGPPEPSNLGGVKKGGSSTATSAS